MTKTDPLIDVAASTQAILGQVQTEMAAATLSVSVTSVVGTSTDVGMAGISAEGVNALNASFANLPTGNVGLSEWNTSYGRRAKTNYTGNTPSSWNHQVLGSKITS